MLLQGEGRKDGLHDALDEVVMKLEELAGSGVRGVRPKERAAGHFGKLSGDAELLTEAQQGSAENNVDFGFSGDFLQIEGVGGVQGRGRGRAPRVLVQGGAG